jgi:hypothetical protein
MQILAELCSVLASVPTRRTLVMVAQEVRVLPYACAPLCDMLFVWREKAGVIMHQYRLISI